MKAVPDYLDLWQKTAEYYDLDPQGTYESGTVINLMLAYLWMRMQELIK